MKKNETKLLTVIIPIYNAKENLNRCLDSILRQSRSDYEILLINDGSTDNSFDIASQYRDSNPEIVKVITQENQGVAKTRNRGVQEAQGKYVMFVDNDDFVDEGYFEQFLNEIQRTNYDIIVGGYKRTTNNSVMYSVNAVNSPWFPYVVVAPWAKIYKRDFLIKNDIQFLSYAIGEDVYFNMCAYHATKQIGILRNTGYNWFFNEKSVSNTSQKKMRNRIDELFLLNEIYEKIGSKGVMYQYFYYRYIIWFLLFSGRESSREELMEEYKRAMLWLKQHDIPPKVYIGNRELKGETRKIRIAVIGFTVLHKLHLISLFSRIYCKG